jgi:hypothetical protein
MSELEILSPKVLVSVTEKLGTTVTHLDDVLPWHFTFQNFNTE